MISFLSSPSGPSLRQHITSPLPNHVLVTSNINQTLSPTMATVAHPSSKPTVAAPAPHDSDAHALRAESTALTRARTNLSYLIAPSSPNSPRPASLRLRLLLRSLHSLGVFLFWRLYRWAKYALVGSVVAALGSVAVAGSVASGAGLFLAPTGIVGTVVAGTVWGVGKWGWRRLWRKRRVEEGKVGGTRGSVVMERDVDRDLAAVPW